MKKSVFTEVGLNLRYFQFHFYRNVDSWSVANFFFSPSKGWFFLIRIFLGIFLQEKEKQQSKLRGLGGLLVSSLANHPPFPFPSCKLYKTMVKPFVQKDAGMIHQRRGFHAACPMSHLPCSISRRCPGLSAGKVCPLWKDPALQDSVCFTGPPSGPETCKNRGPQGTAGLLDCNCDGL